MKGGFVVLTALAVSIAALLTAVATAAPGSGQALGSLEYTCISGPLAGQTKDVALTPSETAAVGFVDGSVFVLESITVTVPGVGVVYHHDYGERNGAGEPSECIAHEGPAVIDVVAAAVGQAAKG